MPDVVWTRLGRPGDVAWARAGDAATVAVGTAGGHLYLRRRTEAGWRWERLGVPPGAENVLDTTLIPVDGADGVVPVVVGGDATVWLHRPGAGPTPWISLSGPTPDVGLPFSASSVDIAASAVRLDTGLRHTLAVNSGAGRPWIRQGIDPSDIWFRVAADADWISSELAAAVASVAQGSAPQPHIFTVAADRESGVQIFRVGVPEGSLWTWIDPGDFPCFSCWLTGLSATAFRDSDGRLQACAIMTNPFLGEGNVAMLIGSGRDWQWFDLGQPTAPDSSGFIMSAVVAAKGPEPKPGEPVVIGRTGDGNIWTRTLTGDWKDLGAAPFDLVVDPASAVEVAAADGLERVFTAGVSQDSDLWTLESDATGRRWEDHGCPGSVVSIVGAYNDRPESDVEDRAIGIPVLDGDGALWTCRIRGNPTFGLTDESKSWAYHGQPAPGVNCASGIGVLSARGFSLDHFWVFVAGSDGHLWARTSGADNWTWVDHGAPTGRSVKTGVPPVWIQDGPAVHVLADDGRLWLRSSQFKEWRWTDRGSPHGQLIFAIVGSATMFTGRHVPVTAAIGDDGHLWINFPDNVASPWIDLGTPTPTERIVAGVGVEAVSDMNGTFDIVVKSAPSDQVWRNRWSIDPWGGATGGAGEWTAHGRPADARIRAAIGVMRDSTNAAGCVMSVIGNDQQVWLASSAGGGWTRWDPRSPATTVTSGRAAMLLNVLPCTVILDNERRVHVVTPTRQ